MIETAEFRVELAAQLGREIGQGAIGPAVAAVEDRGGIPAELTGVLQSARRLPGVLRSGVKDPNFMSSYHFRNLVLRGARCAALSDDLRMGEAHHDDEHEAIERQQRQAGACSLPPER